MAGKGQREIRRGRGLLAPIGARRHYHAADEI
jgi:hypothetical protein